MQAKLMVQNCDMHVGLLIGRSTGICTGCNIRMHLSCMRCKLRFQFIFMRRFIIYTYFNICGGKKKLEESCKSKLGINQRSVRLSNVLCLILPSVFFFIFFSFAFCNMVLSYSSLYLLIGRTMFLKNSCSPFSTSETCATPELSYGHFHWSEFKLTIWWR